jgi:5'-nucleotidase (lipoprotein e(P4) family)
MSYFKNLKTYSFLLIIILSSCSVSDHKSPDSEQMVMSTLWYQRSAEMRALYYQAFNLAEMRVEQAMENYTGEKTPAVVVDIDETILDNSPSEARNILEGERYSDERWMEWTSHAEAEPLPGSLEFARYLVRKGVEMIYISNRKIEEIIPTIENLEKHGFPNADAGHIFLKSESSSKKERREKVADQYNIIMLIGDNLGDFSELFDDRSNNMGKPLVDSLQDRFGKDFIVLPNPIYGSWTSALFRSSGLSPKEIAKRRKSFLIDY